MANFLIYLLPTYGNWGGIGWSGKGYPDGPEETNWNVMGIDSLDLSFKSHDRDYQSAILDRNNEEIDDTEMFERWNRADKDLLLAMECMPKDPREWLLPPEESFLYAWSFRKLSIGVFRLKSWIYEKYQKPVSFSVPKD